MIRVVGIDVGLTGALALIERGHDFGDGNIGDRIVDAIDIPTYGEGAQKRVQVPEVKRWLIAARADFAFVESVWAMPQEGVSSAFKFGRAAGALEAVVACVGVSWRLVAPVTWKAHYKLKGPDKEPSRQLVLHRFPLSGDLFKRKLDHGRAEAVLIAIYGADLIERERGMAA